MAPSAWAATECADSAALPGAQCTSRSTCAGASTREIVENTNCEARGQVCCVYSPSYLNTLRQTCTGAGGIACRATGCRAGERADRTITCPTGEVCCMTQTCADVGGTERADCRDGEISSSDATVPEGQYCCIPEEAAGSGTAKPAGTQALPSAAVASPGNAKGSTVASYGLKNPIGSRSVNDIAAALIRYASTIAGTLMMIFLIWGGIQYMTASDAKGTQAARSRIAWALIGIAVIFFAYVMIDAIISLSGIAPA